MNSSSCPIRDQMQATMSIVDDVFIEGFFDEGWDVKFRVENMEQGSGLRFGVLADFGDGVVTREGDDGSCVAAEGDVCTHEQVGTDVIEHNLVDVVEEELGLVLWCEDIFDVVFALGIRHFIACFGDEDVEIADDVLELAGGCGLDAATETVEEIVALLGCHVFKILGLMGTTLFTIILFLFSSDFFIKNQVSENEKGR